jgi:hypothetical protein
MTLLLAAGYPEQRAERVFEGESLRALPVEGATLAPHRLSPERSGTKRRPCSKLQGISKLKIAMEHKQGCLVCGLELVYLKEPQELACVLCGGKFSTQAKCADNHFICDACHALSANELIERVTRESGSNDPLGMALMLMKSARVKMHGPEHHFLIPAVLLSAFYNARGEPLEKEKKIAKARQRAEHVLGGFCGFYGDCGAAVGTGIFVSLVTDASPLSCEEWKLANLMTAQSLLTIANAGGPRCCKRNSFLAISEAVRFVKERLGVEMEMLPPDLRCEFDHLNRECKKVACRFYSEPAQ